MELLSAEAYSGFAETGWFFQLTLGRKLMNVEHYHHFYEIICILSGECRHVINGEEHTFASGDIVILRPSDSHNFCGQQKDTNVLAISLSIPEMLNFINAYGLSEDKSFCSEAPRGLPPLMNLSGEELAELYELSEEALTQELSERVCTCRIMLGRIMSIFIRHKHVQAIGMPGKFAEIIAQMNNMNAAIEGVPAFLRISNFSHAQLCRLTKRYLGLTPSQFVNSVRMKYAWELVLNSEQRFESICESIGFSSFSYFSRLFTKTFNITPAAARKNNAKFSRTV